MLFGLAFVLYYLKMSGNCGYIYTYIYPFPSDSFNTYKINVTPSNPSILCNIHINKTVKMFCFAYISKYVIFHVHSITNYTI